MGSNRGGDKLWKLDFCLSKGEWSVWNGSL